jgi:hypothetical protein
MIVAVSIEFAISNQDPRHHDPAQSLRRSFCEHSIANASMGLNLQGDLNCRNGTAFSSWRADRRQLQLDEITGGRCLELNMRVSFFLVVPSSRRSAAGVVLPDRFTGRSPLAGPLNASQPTSRIETRRDFSIL